MFRRPASRLAAASGGFWQVLREESAKILPFLSYQAKQTAGQGAAVMQGRDGLSDEEFNREQKKKEYMEFLRKQQKQTVEDPLASDTGKDPTKEGHKPPTPTSNEQQQTIPHEEPTAKAAPPQSIREHLWKSIEELKANMVQSFGTNAGIAALIDHCTRAHAAEAAIASGIDAKSVQVHVKVEKGALGEGQKVVGYIEAPNVSDEQVMEFAHVLTKKCPAARMHGQVEWRRGSPMGQQPPPRY